MAERGGPVLRTAPRRGRDLAKRDEAQGGQRGTRTRSAVSPTCVIRDTEKTSSNFYSYVLELLLIEFEKNLFLCYG